MPFWKREPTYEEPVEAETAAPATMEDESRKLTKLRKKAHKAARRAARESQRAREAARKVQKASTGSMEETREEVAGPKADLPKEMAGADRPKVLGKKEQRKLKRMRRKAQKSS